MAGVWSEESKLARWLDVELAALEGWAELGAVPADAVAEIRERATPPSPERVAELERETQHDLAAFVDAVAAEIGPNGRWIHHGLTSSDVVDTALSLQVRAAGELLLAGLERAQDAVVEQAQRHRDDICIGRTHGVHAEPTTFGLKLAGWVFELDRARGRLTRALETMRVGKLSGAVGTYAATDPELERLACERLGLEPDPVSTQIVQRDRHAELLAALALVAASLEKFALEIRHLARTEVAEVAEPFGKGQKGSSAMPHKRNPVVAERICGLARVVRANALVGLENVALWHERDISHSSAERVVIPDSFLALDYMLERFAWLIEGLDVRPERMRRNLEAGHGLFFSQRLAARARRVGARPRRRLPARPAARAEGARGGAGLPRARARGRGDRQPGRPRRDLRPRLVHTSRRRRLRAAGRARPKGGRGSCLKRPRTSGAARSESCTSSTTIASCSSPATGSRPSTSS